MPISCGDSHCLNDPLADDDSRDNHQHQSDGSGDSKDVDDSDHSGESKESDEFGESDDALAEGDSIHDSEYNGSEYDEFAPFRWLEQMDGEVTLKEQNNSVHIGYCDCKLIRRSQMRHAFYDDMEEPSCETSRLAFDIFDRYGRLRKEFKTHPIKRGTGLWQHELDYGDLLFFEQLQIERGYRRRGLGKRLVEAVLEKTRGKSKSFFAVVQPGWLTRDVEKEIEQSMSDEERADIYGQASNTATHFWRSFGFRRIGSSTWFALASDPDHPCHGLPAGSDHNLPKKPFRIPESGSQSILKWLNETKFREVGIDTPASDVPTLLKELRMKDLEDQQCMDRVRETADKVPISDSSWQATDDDGNNVLHILAMRSKPKSVEWIMSQLPELLNRQNIAGETPLDALEFRLEQSRTMLGTNPLSKIFHISDKFEGFSEESVDCLILLKGLTDPSALDRSRFKFGCTCGQCIMGILSPRMRFALECQGDIQHDTLFYSLDDGELFVEFEESLSLQFVPSWVRENMKTNMSMRKGFTQLCLHFSKCVKEANIVGLPTEENVLHELRNANEWPPVSRNFLSRDGTVYSVGSWLFEAAMNQDLFAGDGEHYEVFQDEIEQLPECRNDHEFGFVSGMCGYERVGQI